jgi:hypothetical protein
MRLEAHLTAADFQHAFEQLTPLTVALDPESPNRQLSLKPPSHVSVLAGHGLRVVTEMQLQWDVIGLRVPVTLRRVVIVMTPSVGEHDGRQSLLFGLRIEEADVSAIPAFVREVVVGRVNEALAKPDVRIAWPFLETLDFGFPLPTEIKPAYSMRLYARSGAVLVEDGSVCLSVEWGLSAQTQPQIAKDIKHANVNLTITELGSNAKDG